jgi:hypothetical protein
MTEEDWLSKAQLVAMLEHARRAGHSERKAHLAAIEFCRQIGHLPFPPEWREAVDRFTEFVEGNATLEQLSAADKRLNSMMDWSGVATTDGPDLLAFQRLHGDRAALFLIRLVPRPGEDRAVLGAKYVAYCANMAHGAGQERKVRAGHCAIVRDIFGNPFRPVAFSPSWRTSAARDLARAMYESRDFSPMPILADALEEAGCDNADILTHCRGNGPHVRGCWVVDLVLGRL